MNTLSQVLSEVRLGEAQYCGNLTIVPILGSWGEQEIMPMSEAIATRQFVVTEVEPRDSEVGPSGPLSDAVEDEGTTRVHLNDIDEVIPWVFGLREVNRLPMSERLDFPGEERDDSVSKVRAINLLDQPVLLIEGEEITGARQDRVVNSTILVAPHTEIQIPVSCSERRRWKKVSEQFADSGVVAPPSVRATKSASVDRALRSGEGRISDQRAVWRAIDDVARRAGTRQTTGAMRDVFRGRNKDLRRIRAQFTMVEEQVGFLAIVNGEAVALDCVSSTAVCRSLFAKLIRSYAMEAILTGDSAEWDDVHATARKFLYEFDACEETMFAGVCLGNEYRYTCPGLIGSALVQNGQLMHAALHRRRTSTVPTW